MKGAPAQARPAVIGWRHAHRHREEARDMKVLLIDDHPLILSALQGVIRLLGDDVTVVGVDGARSARTALKSDPDFDLVLLDLTLGDADGFEVLAEIREGYPAVPVVVLSASERPDDVMRALDGGAMGFVPKKASNAALFEALRMVMSGGVYVPRQMLGGHATPREEDAEGDTVPAVMRVSSITSSPPMRAEPPAPAAPGAAALARIGLTPRQTDVLTLLLQGKPNKLIARELKLSVETVKDHVAAVLRALNVTTRTQAVLVVSRLMQGLDGPTGPGVGAGAGGLGSGSLGGAPGGAGTPRSR